MNLIKLITSTGISLFWAAVLFISYQSIPIGYLKEIYMKNDWKYIVYCLLVPATLWLGSVLCVVFNKRIKLIWLLAFLAVQPLAAFVWLYTLSGGV